MAELICHRRKAVIDIIHAKNELALKNSLNQLKGNVVKKIKSIRKNILYDTAYIEAALDDPEHISLDGFSEDLKIRVESNQKILTKLISTSENGRMIKEGIRTVILGRPNAGKSSLMNILAGENRAIVTDIPGTTRDTIEETIYMNGICINLIDTAGICETKDIVEKLGIDRSLQKAREADLIIYVIDASLPLDDNDTKIIEFIQERKTIVLLNKSDLTSVIEEEEIKRLTDKPVIRISALKQVGLERIERTIENLFFEGKLTFDEDIYITNIRHKNALIEANKSLEQVYQSIITGMPEDFFTIDLMNAYEILGTILGESIDEDLINTIFKEFCMGK